MDRVFAVIQGLCRMRSRSTYILYILACGLVLLCCKSRVYSAIVSVDTTQTTVAISSDFYGINAHPSTASYEFGDAQLARDLSPDIIRIMPMHRTEYPKGQPKIRYELSPSEGVYDWTHLDDLLTVVDDIGAKAHIALGFGAPSWLGEEVKTNRRRVSPEEFPAYAQVMADVVAHMDQLYPGLVSAVTIENEPENLKYDIDDYTELVNAASRAIRAVSPSTRIAGPVTGYAYWNQSDGSRLSFAKSMEMLRRVNPGYDMIDWHIYTKSVDKVIHSVDVVKEHWPGMPLVISELNRNWRYGSDPAGQQSVIDNNGWESVAWLAESYDRLQRQGLDQVHYFAIAGTPFGLYDYHHTETRPNYHLFYLMTNIMGRQRVQAESDDSDVGIIATVDEQGRTALLLYNRTSEAKSVSLDLEGLSPEAPVDVYRLEEAWYDQHKAIINGGAQLLEPTRMPLPSSLDLLPGSVVVLRGLPGQSR
jgi:Glycosyl hydrolases family 39